MPIVDPIHPLGQLLKRDPRYKLDAYLFVLEALTFAQDSLGLGSEPPAEDLEPSRGSEDAAVRPRSRPAKQRRKQAERHLSGQQLCEAARQYALQQYGYLARTVLGTWGIRSTADLGEIVFNENLGAQCVACHRIGKEGSEVGPPLTEIGKKGREYILESLLAPQAKIAAGYGMMSLKMKDGTTLAGALKQEDKKFLSLILPDKKEVVINLAEVDSRTTPVSTMPPMGAILTPRQLRDLVEYLSGLK